MAQEFPSKTMKARYQRLHKSFIIIQFFRQKIHRRCIMLLGLKQLGLRLSERAKDQEPRGSIPVWLLFQENLQFWNLFGVGTLRMEKK